MNSFFLLFSSSHNENSVTDIFSSKTKTCLFVYQCDWMSYERLIDEHHRFESQAPNVFFSVIVSDSNCDFAVASCDFTKSEKAKQITHAIVKRGKQHDIQLSYLHVFV